MTERKFHHGNLRAALLELAEAEIEQVGFEGLLLRNLAARLGVSSAAPYKHFKSRNALLMALAEVGSQYLHQIYQAALDMDAAAAARLRVACQGYLRFAENKPELYRLMFVSRPEWYEEQSSEMERLSPTFWLFHRLVAEALGEPAGKDTLDQTFVTWSQIHGFAMLRLNHRLDRFADAPRLAAAEDAVLDRACSCSTGR